MGDVGDAAPIHRLRQGGGTQLGEGGRWVSSAGTTTTASTGSSSSLFSSTSSSLTDDDDATSCCPPPGRRPISSSSFSSSTSSLTTTSSSEKMQTMDDAGPLYELSTMLDHLPSLRYVRNYLRTGLSKYYRGRSQSFITSLAEVSCVEDLAKKSAPCIRRTKASRRYAAAALGAKNQLSKKIAKKAPADSLLSKASWNKTPTAYHGKREVYRC